MEIEDDSISCIRLVQSFTSLGPIVDFCVVDKEGQGVVVACCGVYKDSSVRVIRNGVGVDIISLLNGADGVCGVWSIKASPEDL